MFDILLNYLFASPTTFLLYFQKCSLLFSPAHNLGPYFGPMFGPPKKVPQKSWDLARSKAIFGAVSMVITARPKTQILIFCCSKSGPYFGPILPTLRIIITLCGGVLTPFNSHERGGMLAGHGRPSSA